MVNGVVERDVARAETQDVHAERDQVICLAETREVARIKTVLWAARQAMEFDTESRNSYARLRSFS